MTLAAALQAKRRHLAYRGAGKLDQYEQIGIAVQEIKRRRDREVPLEATPERLGKAPAAFSRNPVSGAHQYKTPLETHARHFESHELIAGRWWADIVELRRKATAPSTGGYKELVDGGLAQNYAAAMSTFSVVERKLALCPKTWDCMLWMADAVNAYIEASGKQMSVEEWAAKWFSLAAPAARRGYTTGMMTAALERLYELMVLEKALDRKTQKIIRAKGL